MLPHNNPNPIDRPLPVTCVTAAKTKERAPAPEVPRAKSQRRWGHIYRLSSPADPCAMRRGPETCYSLPNICSLTPRPCLPMALGQSAKAGKRTPQSQGLWTGAPMPRTQGDQGGSGGVRDNSDTVRSGNSGVCDPDHTNMLIMPLAVAGPDGSEGFQARST